MAGSESSVVPGTSVEAPAVDVSLGSGLAKPSPEAVAAFQSAMAKPLQENAVLGEVLKSLVKVQPESIDRSVPAEVKPLPELVAENKEITKVLVETKPLEIGPKSAAQPEGIFNAKAAEIAKTAKIVEPARDIVLPEVKPLPELVAENKEITKVLVEAKPLEIGPKSAAQPEEIFNAKAAEIAKTVEPARDIVMPEVKPLPELVIENKEIAKVLVAAEPLTIVPKEVPEVAVIEKPVIAEIKPLPELVTENKEIAKVLVEAKPLEIAPKVVPDDEDVVAVSAAVSQQVVSAVMPEKPVAPVAAERTVDAVAPATVDAVAATRTDVFIQAANAVADTLLVTPGLMRGEGEVRIQLKPDVLDGSEVRIAVEGRHLEVEFLPVAPEIVTMIDHAVPRIQQTLEARIDAFDIAVKVSANVATTQMAGTMVRNVKPKVKNGIA